MSAQSTSFLDDLAYAVRNVLRTLLRALTVVALLILGVALLTVGLVVAAVLWVGHKLRLIKEPPRAVFARWQMRFMQKLMASRMEKIMGRMQEQMHAQQGNQASAGPRRVDHPTEVDAEDVDAEEVDAEELENFHGTLDEYLRRKRG